MRQLIITEQTFANRLNDKAAVIAAYERHNAQVRAAVPKARLLEFESTQGWEPLCRFPRRSHPGNTLPQNQLDRGIPRSRRSYESALGTESHSRIGMP